jgi:hypothetical protein
MRGRRSEITADPPTFTHEGAMSTTKEKRPGGTCNGLEFVMTEYWKFEVPSLAKQFDTYEVMREAIERSQKEIEAASRQKLNIAAIADTRDKQVRAVITGVHAGHGQLISKPKFERFDRPDFYPDVPLVSLALAEERRLDIEKEEVSRVLKALKLNCDKYRSFAPSMHAGEISRIEKKVAGAIKNGNLSLKEAIAKLKPDDDDED